jgi:hypothetical protein
MIARTFAASQFAGTALWFSSCAILAWFAREDGVACADTVGA